MTVKTFMCVPAKLGAKGVEGVIELDLTDHEKEQVAATAHNLRDLVALLS